MEKIKKDQFDDRKDRAHATFDGFMTEKMLRKFGLKKMAQEELQRVLITLMEYYDQSTRISVFVDLMNVASPLMNFIMYW